MYNKNNNNCNNSNNINNINNNNINNNTMVKKIKLVLLGNSGAGKTCIVQRMTYNTFNYNDSITIGAAYTIYTVETNIKIEIWDTAGQERFHSLLPLYARSAEIIIVVIDIEKNIDEQFLKWNKYIQDNEKLFSPNFKLILIFNKHDLNNDFEIPKDIINQTQFSFITLVSAKTGYNIDKLKLHLGVTVKKYIDEHTRASHEHRNKLNNSNNNNNNNNSSSNIENSSDDTTIFGYTFSNIKINGFLEYKEKMKKCIT
jgi:small GTP-binding protein